MERRTRNPDTGEIYIEGSGFFDTLSNIGSKVAAKLTGKTAKKLASKATEKLIEKGSEKVGEKTGQLIGEKIYNNFSDKPKQKKVTFQEQPEIMERRNNDMVYKDVAIDIKPKGDEIVKLLQKENGKSKNEDKYEYIKDVYKDFLI